MFTSPHVGLHVCEPSCQPVCASELLSFSHNISHSCARVCRRLARQCSRTTPREHMFDAHVPQAAAPPRHAARPGHRSASLSRRINRMFYFPIPCFPHLPAAPIPPTHRRPPCTARPVPGMSCLLVCVPHSLFLSLRSRPLARTHRLCLSPPPWPSTLL
jgi:hypothetical protein